MPPISPPAQNARPEPVTTMTATSGSSLQPRRAAMDEGPSRILNYSRGADCQSTLACMEALGARVERSDDVTIVHGVGLDGLKAPAAMLDAGNSGSTIRMLSGILAAQPFATGIAG